jgi:acetoacetyl-CoA synthetase
VTHEGADGLPPGEVAEGELLWTPGPERVAAANLTAYLHWLRAGRGLDFPGYRELWQWSVNRTEDFWQSMWDWFDIRASAPPERVLGSAAMPGAQWFPGARLNYAEHALRRERPGETALLHLDETHPLTAMSWEELGGQVRRLATRLRELGVRPGDRVASWLPNVPQTVVAMLATTAIGAIWASCSPDFGWAGALDRFAQLEPVVLFAVDGYRYGGRDFDRRPQLAAIVDGLPGLRHAVLLPRGDVADLGREPLSSDGSPEADGSPDDGPAWTTWSHLLDGPDVPAQGFAFEQVPFDHPLWVLFSSGTTGLPKAIVHGHGGILLEQLKLQTFHLDLHPGDRLFFATTTGWMMWNFLASALAAGVVPVLYDGNPAYPEPDVLWRMAQDARATVFGASPSYVDIMVREGVVPKDRYDLSALRAVMPAGSPVPAWCTAWFYRNVSADLWVATGSGGTDCCTGFVGGVPTLPVYAGEIQAPSLGVAAFAFDDHGEAVIDQVGELVITRPLPSMPVRLWGDEDGRRYRDTYFADYPGVWRHGDFFRVNARGGCFVLGRSDATLNRHGVRIGTAEIYRALAGIEQIEDAVVVNLDLPGGRFFMPLFVKLRCGVRLDAELETAIRDRIRAEYTPRHVPDQIVAVGRVPTTLTGKKMEVPVRKVLLGVPPEQAANPNAMADPAALDEYAGYARTQHDYPFPVVAPAS